MMYSHARHHSIARSGLVLCFALVLLIPGLLIPLTAQAQEAQVPLSPDSTVTSIDAELRRTLELFPEADGFQRAQLYQVGPTTYELVIEYRPAGQILRERRTLTADEVEQLRQRVAAQLRATNTRVGLNQEGQVGLIASTTFLGLVEGSLLAGALDTDSESVAALPLMGGAMGFFAPLLVTQNATVTEAEADLTFYGGIQGYAHAAQLAAFASRDPDGPAVSALAAVLGAAESTAGYLTARNNGWSGGHAEMTSFTGISGNLLGLGLGATLVGESTEDASRQVIAGLSFLGSFSGAYLGHRMGRTNRYTQGDARIYFQTGLQAVNLMGSLLVNTDVEGTGAGALITAAGAGGLALGRRLVRGRTFSKSEANLTFLGSVAGSLLGGGLAALSDADGASVALLQGLGSGLGFGITYGLFADDARRRTAPSTAGIDLEMRLEPHLDTPVGRGRTGGLHEQVIPKVTLRATF